MLGAGMRRDCPRRLRQAPDRPRQGIDKAQQAQRVGGPFWIRMRSRKETLGPSCSPIDFPGNS